MSDWTLSIVMIVPIELQDIANRISCALGYDTMPGNTFSVPLFANGFDPATHYGCRTSAKQEFVDLVTNGDIGLFPDIPWSDYNLTTDEVASVLSILIIDVRPSNEVINHFESVLNANSLMLITQTI
jgi:hypothetical protein